MSKFVMGHFTNRRNQALSYLSKWEKLVAYGAKIQTWNFWFQISFFSLPGHSISSSGRSVNVSNFSPPLVSYLTASFKSAYAHSKVTQNLLSPVLLLSHFQKPVPLSKRSSIHTWDIPFCSEPTVPLLWKWGVSEVWKRCQDRYSREMIAGILRK